jgi:hypothetical protein
VEYFLEKNTVERGVILAMNTRKKHNTSKEELEYRQSRLLYSEESTSLVKSQSRLFIQE